MVKIAPFHGFRYSRDRVPDFDSVVSPPYDVIGPELQKKLHEASEYNVAHVIKGKKLDDDSEDNNEFTRARRMLDEWIDKGVLVRESEPSIYVIAQEFEVEGRRMTRAGFIALVRLEDMCTKTDAEGTCVGVHQHEETLPKDIENRLNLLTHTRANFGLIFSIYTEPERVIDGVLEKVMKGEPLMEVADDDGIVHRLWAISDMDTINRMQEVMDNRYIIIADGHHRYKTALRYSKEHPDNESARYRMLAFVNTMNPGLVILPTHRLVQGIEGFDPSTLVAALARDFALEEFEFSGDDSEARAAMFGALRKHFENGRHALGLYCNDGRYYALLLENESTMDAVSGHSDAWKHLDVTILHKMILEDLLGIDPKKVASGTIQGGSYVEYVKAVGDAVQSSVDKVNKMGYQAVFFMNPTKVEEVEAVATNHETMPQKSTFFYPKVYTGFVINRLE
jgi:uncharacterized protein (DUF1015 family)